MAIAAVAHVSQVSRGYDVFGDEIDYVDLGMSASHGAFPPRYGHTAFLLHPPLTFYMTAAWTLIWGSGGNYFHLITQTRYLNIVLAVLTAGLLYGLGSRLGGRVCGAVTAVLFAIDPYVLRQNDRVLLETPTLIWVIAGLLILVGLVAGKSRFPWLSAIAGGALLGMSVVANTIAVVLVVPPLVFALWRRWGRRDYVLAALIASVAPYTIYLCALAGVGQVNSFISQERLGAERMLGLLQTTGFNRPGSPSLVSTLIHQFLEFGVTYVLVAIGVVAAVYLLARHPRAEVRYFATVVIAATATLVYAVLLGTIEEQFLYYLYVPALVVIPLAISLWLSRRSVRSGRRWARVAFGALAILIIYDATLAVHTARTPDDGEQMVTQWLRAHPGGRGVVANDTDATTGLLKRSGIAAIDITTPAAARHDNVRYVTLLSAQERGDYTTLSRSEERYFISHGTKVFSFNEPTYGDVTIWRTTDPGAW